ncbi:IpaC/SipC family type III secretion system effector [Chromobacterium haemolyticum]|uniref:IpaC/SipC family type III secretion system effector n=1 Tax=Chromobacterium haemolyticum TaxID=394935 RepID=UPI00131760F8|nr:IpaC/SipC family type III secretion system effector [Chromobacterium haemolyticum]BBH14956.1 cell invasion protein [Chromobacterium haemolyticum]
MPNTINTVSTHALYSTATEAGAAEKSSVAKSLVDIKDILPILNSAGRDGKALAEVMSGPQLRPPSAEVSKQVTDALKSYLSEKAQDPAFVQDLGAVYQKVESGVSKLVDDKVKEQAEQGKPFDISGMAPNGAALMVAAIVLMSALRTADNTLSSKLSLVGFDATKATAASMVREGVANLSSSVVQSVGQMAITGVGAKKSLSGINAERGALKNNAPKLAKAGDESRNIQTTLNRQNSVKLGAEPDSLKHVGLKQQQPGAAKLGAGEPGMQSNAAGSVADGMAGDKIGLKSSNQNLSKPHESALSSASEDLPVKSQIEQQTMDDTKLKAQAKQTTGKAIMESSSAASNIAGGSGRYAATLEQSEQQISQASSRVANTASEETRESSRKSDSVIQELLRTLDSISQSKNAAMGAVAGNIRA